MRFSYEPFIFPEPAGDKRVSFDILSDVEDSEGVFFCMMRWKEVSSLVLW